MQLEGLLQQASPFGRRQVLERPLERLLVLRQPRPSPIESSLYEPVLCLILQGRKDVTIGDQTLSFGPGECLLVTHDLPVRSQITDAPYLSLIFEIDIATIRKLYDEVGAWDLAGEPPQGLDPRGRFDPRARAADTHRIDPGLRDALERYLALAQAPGDAKVLAPLISKEIHYRLLVAPFGGMLRCLLRHDSHASAIARAITHLRSDLGSPISIPDLARRVGMSPSAFHKHFKRVTSTTPLQYQKDIRLLEARRLLRTRTTTVTTAAYEVGYESPSQFSREYTRKFGVPPSQDVNESRAES